MNFKITKNKLKASIIAPIIWYLLLNFYFAMLCTVMRLLCNCNKGFSLFYDCCGCSSSFLSLLIQIILILFPGVLLYIIISLFQKKNMKNKRK